MKFAAYLAFMSTWYHVLFEKEFNLLCQYRLLLEMYVTGTLIGVDVQFHYDRGVIVDLEISCCLLSISISVYHKDAGDRRMDQL